MIEKVEEVVFKALSHPIRRRIVYTIGKSGYASFTDLSKIEPRVGLLYYHLNIMKDLLYQDEKKRYRLSEIGKKAYELLISGEDLEDYEIYTSRRNTFSLLSLVLTPAILFEHLFKMAHKSLFGIIFLVGGIGLILSSAQLVPLLLFLVPMRNTPVSILMLTYVDWLIVSLLVCSLLHIIYRKNCFKIFFETLMTSAIAQLPLALFSAIWWLFPTINSLKEISMLLLLSFQAWSLWILTTGIKVSTQLSTRRAILIPLLIQYLGTIVLLYLSW